MRSKFAKDHVRDNETAGLDVFVGIFQSPMEGGSIFLVEPVSGIERQELDLGSFGQIGWLIDDEAASLDPSLQCHVTTVASPKTEDKRSAVDCRLCSAKPGH